MRLHAVGMTDIGNVRAENQDSFTVETAACAQNGSSLLAVVADGVGGGKAGNVASALAVETLREVFLESAGEPLELMKEGMETANSLIFQRSSSDEGCSGMATTCTALMVKGGSVIVGHVGDSRAYRIREGEVAQLTEDHTLPRRLLKQGLITPEQLESHPQGNVLTSAMGSRSRMQCDVFAVDLKERDTVVLCSDGMHKYLRGDEIREIIRNSGIEGAPEQLVTAAKERGGDDNITVVVVHASGEEFDKTTEILTSYEPPLEARRRGRGKLLLGALLLCIIVAVAALFRK